MLVWFRQDLRLADQPALAAAVARGGPVIAAYVLDDETPGPWRLGGASRWWLHHSLMTLGAALAGMGIPLILRKGRSEAVIPALADEAGAAAVYWCRQYEPYARARDENLKARLRKAGLAADSFNGALLFEPWTIKKGDGGPFRVFTPFWRACRASAPPPAPVKAAGKVPGMPHIPGLELDALGLLPHQPDWAGGLCARWTPGEAGARAGLRAFLKDGLARYAAERDKPAADAISGLSPPLHFGEISPRTLWHAVQARAEEEAALAGPAEKFLSELGWREFAHHLLFHNPKMPDAPLDPAFADFPWSGRDADFKAWTKGLTGYPIVDAGMRELWRTGTMHNRVRMIAASFLIKDLLIPWQRGAAWFWDTLVDADLANNSMGWQWVTGCGADAAPFFRMFNPVLQGERFDPDGAYIRRFLPELAALPNPLIHRPWTAPQAVLDKAGIRLGEIYPHPIVDHSEARSRALSAFQQIKRASPGAR